jgi:hypothetical protein
VSNSNFPPLNRLQAIVATKDGGLTLIAGIEALERWLAPTQSFSRFFLLLLHQYAK